MNLKFQILWIDDTKEWVDSVTQSLREYMLDNGFSLDLRWLPDGEKFVEACQNPDLDLILVDLNLPGMSGDQIIKGIRQRDVYVDIIFYSQGQNPVARAPTEDGIYYRERSDVSDTVRSLFETVIRRTHHINIMRGLVIAEAIDIENQLSHVMAGFLGPRGEFYLEHVLRKKGLPIYDFQKKITFVQAMLNELITDARQAKNNERTTRLQELKKIFNDIEAEVVDIRNILAHAEREVRDSNKFYLEGINNRTKFIECTKEWCQKARKDLLKHAANVESIRRELVAHPLPAVPLVPPSPPNADAPSR